MLVLYFTVVSLIVSRFLLIRTSQNPIPSHTEVRPSIPIPRDDFYLRYAPLTSRNLPTYAQFFYLHTFLVPVPFSSLKNILIIFAAF